MPLRSGPSVAEAKSSEAIGHGMNRCGGGE